MVPAPTFVIPGGPLVRAAFRHEGAARVLVHRLKYQALWTAALPLVERLCEVMADSGDRVDALVPVPRAQLRRGIYGVDPALVIAHEVAARTGLAVVRALVASPWWPRHAKRGRLRPEPRLRLVRPPGCHVALVDDVVTTGTTCAVAARLVGGVSVVYAGTLGGRVGSLGPSRARSVE